MLGLEKTIIIYVKEKGREIKHIGTEEKQPGSLSIQTNFPGS